MSLFDQVQSKASDLADFYTLITGHSAHSDEKRKKKGGAGITACDHASSQRKQRTRAQISQAQA